MNVETSINTSADSSSGFKTQAPPVLLELKNVKKYFAVRRGIMASLKGYVKAVDGVSFTIERGQTFGLVGESGCGKTTTAQMILGVEPTTSGEIYFKGKDIAHLNRQEHKEFRLALQAVFQDPASSLDPRMRIGTSIAEPISMNLRDKSPSEIKQRVGDLLKVVGLKPDFSSLYPHEFSGGMRQRIAIARSLAPNPELIILDEPVSALDVSIRAQIMNLLRELQDRFGFSYLLIAHNLATVRHMSNHMGVMYVGKLVEEGDSEEIFKHTLHPYTKALIRASLPIHPDVVQLIVPLGGETPSPFNAPPGCRLNPRCSQVMPVCSKEEPAFLEVAPNHRVACHLYK